ncbi:glycoside hydrolase family 73 protein [Carnobacteriaceae bacterium zg-ZUI78]|nr:glycoside hydrolase family 73 protein [Carnobacteriaceae bacterium zg-ZUI78]
MMKRKYKIVVSRAFGMSLMIIASFLVVLLILAQSHSKQEENQANHTGIAEQEKIDFFSKIAVSAQENQEKYGVLSSITMAQAGLESEYGRSQLASKYYNLFGVKGSQYDGVALPTKEFYNGQWHTVHAYFKVYPSWKESIEQHGRLLHKGTSWNEAQYKAVIEAKNYKQAASALVEGGYATDPQYAEKIVSIIETYQLYKYDK